MSYSIPVIIGIVCGLSIVNGYVLNTDAAGSCKELKARDGNLKSGLFDIRVGDETIKMFCDMESDGGGWLMVGSASVKKEEESGEVFYSNILSEDYHQLSNVTTGRFLMDIVQLATVYPVEEIRFSCSKDYHKRKVNIKTTKTELGKAAVDWLLKRKSWIPKPKSCGSFVPLPDDNSFLGQNCARWEYATWWHQNLYYYPVIGHDKTHLYAIALDYVHAVCDDVAKRPSYSNIGQWNWYVR